MCKSFVYATNCQSKCFFFKQGLYIESMIVSIFHYVNLEISSQKRQKVHANEHQCESVACHFTQSIQRCFYPKHLTTEERSISQLYLHSAKLQIQARLAQKLEMIRCFV